MMKNSTSPAARAKRTKCLSALVPQCLLLIALGAPAAEPEGKWKPAYENDPAVAKQLEALGDNTALTLPVKVLGLEGGHEKNGWLKDGPFTCGYCMKMAYAPDRKTAFYCGQDHNLPHYNDAWEFHLGSASWHCLSNPDGGDTGVYWRNMMVNVFGRNGKGMEPDEKKREELRAKLKEYMEKTVRLKDGYLQTVTNGGPVFAWHTWDGLSYDPSTGRMYWAVLDDDGVMKEYLKSYCTITGADFAALEKDLKPGMGLWSFDPGTKKWARWSGTGPHPRMRGMGGSFTYIPDLKKTVWYVAAFNVSPADCQMWIYDAVADKWEDMKPKGDWGRKESPGSEAQMAYSPKHKKIVAVVGKDTFVYDFATNAWSKACTEEGQHASDSRSVFAYDSASDVFLLYNAPKGEWDKARDLRAFDLKTLKWEKLAPQGAAVPTDCRKGYYDPEHNALVIAGQGPVWVYRYKKTTPPAPQGK